MRAVARLGALACLFAVVSLGVGCGNRTELPQESGGGIIPPTNTYVVKQVWLGFEGAGDMVLTSGSQLFVAFPELGRVVGYFSTSVDPRENGTVLTGIRPHRLTEGLDRTLIVADVDSLGAQVLRVYSQVDGAQLAVLRDEAWTEIGGVAADDDGYIYVSDLVTNVVRKYESDGEFVLELAHEGTGAGFVLAPDGLDWQPDRVLVVDSGKQWIQGLDPMQAGHALFFKTGSDNPLGAFAGLSDVAGDQIGNLYIVDTRNAAILKYDPEGVFDQRVEQNALPGSSGFVAEPIAVTVNLRLAYVLDRAEAKVVTFELDL